MKYNYFTEVNYNKVISYISNLRNNNKDVNCLLEDIEYYGDLIFIGGAIRDIGLLGIKPRDFDIIVDTSSSNIDRVFEKYNFIKNRFGGYKLSIGNLEFDIWSIDNNWAFKNKFLETKKENIKDGIFYNIDSIYLNLNEKYYEANYFNTALKEKILDIVMDEDMIYENPSKSLNVVRAFILKEKFDLDFSEKLRNYIKEWKDETEDPFREISASYYKHYKTKKINKYLYNELEYL